jgi:hypothetical protein
VVQGLLGHSHARTTQRYAHLAQETLLDAAQLVGTIVAGGCENPYPEAADAGIDALLSAQNRSDPSRYRASRLARRDRNHVATS